MNLVRQFLELFLKINLALMRRPTQVKRHPGLARNNLRPQPPMVDQRRQRHTYHQHRTPNPDHVDAGIPGNLQPGDNPRSLLNLRKRLAHIRVFDPACGSGNFLVIAYKEMRKIEHEINRRRGEPERASDIPLTNFRGIELRSFAAEIARLALHIAEFQCDELYRGQLQAIRDFIPLPARNSDE